MCVRVCGCVCGCVTNACVCTQLPLCGVREFLSCLSTSHWSCSRCALGHNVAHAHAVVMDGGKWDGACMCLYAL